MKNNEWRRNNRTLLTMIDGICNRILKEASSASVEEEKKIMEKYNMILERLMDYAIEHVTIGDIKDFIKRKLGQDIDIDVSDEDIIRFIMDEQNREDLTRFGQLRNPIDTRLNDYWQRENNLERDDRW